MRHFILLISSLLSISAFAGRKADEYNISVIPTIDKNTEVAKAFKAHTEEFAQTTYYHLLQADPKCVDMLHFYVDHPDDAIAKKQLHLCANSSSQSQNQTNPLAESIAQANKLNPHKTSKTAIDIGLRLLPASEKAVRMIYDFTESLYSFHNQQDSRRNFPVIDVGGTLVDKNQYNEFYKSLITNPMSTVDSKYSEYIKRGEDLSKIPSWIYRMIKRCEREPAFCKDIEKPLKDLGGKSYSDLRIDIATQEYKNTVKASKSLDSLLQDNKDIKFLVRKINTGELSIKDTLKFLSENLQEFKDLYKDDQKRMLDEIRDLNKGDYDAAKLNNISKSINEMRAGASILFMAMNLRNPSEARVFNAITSSSLNVAETIISSMMEGSLIGPIGIGASIFNAVFIIASSFQEPQEDPAVAYAKEILSSIKDLSQQIENLTNKVDLYHKIDLQYFDRIEVELTQLKYISLATFKEISEMNNRVISYQLHTEDLLRHIDSKTSATEYEKCLIDVASTKEENSLQFKEWLKGCIIRFDSLNKDSFGPLYINDHKNFAISEPLNFIGIIDLKEKSNFDFFYNINYYKNFFNSRIEPIFDTDVPNIPIWMLSSKQYKAFLFSHLYSLLSNPENTTHLSSKGESVTFNMIETGNKILNFFKKSVANNDFWKALIKRYITSYNKYLSARDDIWRAFYENSTTSLNPAFSLVPNALNEKIMPCPEASNNGPLSIGPLGQPQGGASNSSLQSVFPSEVLQFEKLGLGHTGMCYTLYPIGSTLNKQKLFYLDIEVHMNIYSTGQKLPILNSRVTIPFSPNLTALRKIIDDKKRYYNLYGYIKNGYLFNFNEDHIYYRNNVESPIFFLNFEGSYMYPSIFNDMLFTESWVIGTDQYNTEVTTIQKVFNDTSFKHEFFQRDFLAKRIDPGYYLQYLNFQSANKGINLLYDPNYNWNNYIVFNDKTLETLRDQVMHAFKDRVNSSVPDIRESETSKDIIYLQQESLSKELLKVIGGEEKITLLDNLNNSYLEMYEIYLLIDKFSKISKFTGTDEIKCTQSIESIHPHVLDKIFITEINIGKSSRILFEIAEAVRRNFYAKDQKNNGFTVPYCQSNLTLLSEIEVEISDLNRFYNFQSACRIDLQSCVSE